ncbi:MAG: endolytic transglycosylase MltG [Sphingobacteriaceae bacterium]|nr:endolytic transglycosylase MltG [Sphingobacteriaceae bacterium]
MTTPENKKKSKKNIIWISLFICFAIGVFVSVKIYNNYFYGNVNGNQKYLYIKSTDNYESLLAYLEKKNILIDIEKFKEAAKKMKLSESVKPGRYRLEEGMSNRTLINMIKAGNQDPVKLKFQNIRKKENFAGYLAKNMQADSLSFLKAIESDSLIKKYGFTKDNIYTMFIPNTYEIYWNISPEDFFEKMHKEYDEFWTENRKNKAKELNLSPQEVTILASIVDSEALYDKEMPIIAGLYLNRLKSNKKLQADPTVIFANNDFTVKRVTNRLLQSPSKYNTYKYAGLPPGPIMMPSIHAIDAVLDFDENDYIYMCAKEDFSGYHNFAATKEEHEANANKYRAALNQRKIFK